MMLYLSIGTNEGDRKANIGEALCRLERYFGKPPRAVSRIVESESWGFEGGDFLDCAVSFDTDLDPLEILSACKRIEYEMGRRDTPEFAPDGSRIYHDRIIDIDILMYGDLRMKTEKLEIPHPHMKERDFIMGPLMEIFTEND